VAITAVDPSTDCATFLLWRIAKTGNLSLTGPTFATLSDYGWQPSDVLTAVLNLSETHVALRLDGDTVVVEGR
jgi:hypothetical protein